MEGLAREREIPSEAHGRGSSAGGTTQVKRVTSETHAIPTRGSRPWQQVATGGPPVGHARMGARPSGGTVYERSCKPKIRITHNVTL